MEILLKNTDYLSRQSYLDLLKSIITNQRDNPSDYSFTIDGNWSFRKPWRLQELENYMCEIPPEDILKSPQI